MDETIAEIKRRIAEQKTTLAPGDHRRLHRDDGGRTDRLAEAEYVRREGLVAGLDLALAIIDETVR
jgi:hypothetical protein